MMSIWENPMLSIDDRLGAAVGEIDRLRELLQTAGDLYHGARSKITDAEKQRDELLAAIREVIDDAEECQDNDEWTAMLVSLDAFHNLNTAYDSAIAKVGAGGTATEGHNVQVSSGAQTPAKTAAGSPSAAP